MTNGDKLKEVFPSIELYEKSHDAIQINFDSVWWNAEYKEPTTKNLCDSCRNSTNCMMQSEIVRKECGLYKPTTKNDLADDKTFYEQIVEYCNEHFLVLVEKDVWEDAKKALTTKNDLGVDSTPHFISFKEMMDNLKITAEDIENAEDLEYSIEPLILPKNDLGVDCIDKWDIGGKEAELWIVKGKLQVRHRGTIHNIDLPSVTPQEPRKGHWIVQPSNKEQGERDFIWWKCSECGQVIFSETEKDRKEFHAFCSRCGANMESEESK